MALVPTLGRIRSAPVIDCLAAVEPTLHPELEAVMRQCLQLALPAEVTSPAFSWPFLGMVSVKSILGTRFGQNRSAQDAGRRLEQT
ncbi:MAG: hypothetical protein DCF18_04890 [Cyanobium sp.]|nr:MAG: hypothetical protein DCF18_04890 [Cyanobium sp.]